MIQKGVFAMSAQPLLSIGMIVKNESRCLEKCLKALEPLRSAIPCELVIADTGSTDSTKEIASRYADTLFDFPWVNDFSKARNAVMDRCKGIWFMTLDADEYLESSPDELIALVTDKSNLKYSCATFVKRNYSSITLQGLYNDFSAIRIVKLTPNVRYTGAIHEKLNNIDMSTCVTLSKTIFAHDGYATIDADLSKEKAKRNLALLEIEYQKTPNDATIILQLIESAHVSKKESYEKSVLGMNFISKLNKNSADWKLIAPAIARKILQYAVSNNFSEVSEWFDWTYKNLPDSSFTLIDTTYLYAQWLFSIENFELAEATGKQYLENIKNFEARKNNTVESMISSMLFSHELYQQNIAVLIAKAAIENGNTASAIEYLKNIDISSAYKEAIIDWLNTLSKIDSDEAIKILKLHSDSFSDSVTDMIRDFLFSEFSSKHADTNHLKKYTILNSDVGLYAKIAVTEDINDTKRLVECLENFDEIPPCVFLKILENNFNVSNKFYRIALEKLQKLFDDIIENHKNPEDIILKYTSAEALSDFNQLSFAFNLLISFWSKEKSSNEESLIEFKNRFYEISKLLLTNLYNADILANEETFCTLPTSHQFAIYYVLAIEAEDFKEKISLLRQAIKQATELKQLVTFTLEEFKKEQTKLARDKQLSASPELLEMAKNIKALLSNYAEDDPALIAIKQSPVYKQVAHLIED